MAFRGIDCLVFYGNDAAFGRGMVNFRYITHIASTMGGWAIFPLEGDPVVYCGSPHLHVPYSIYRSIQEWVSDIRPNTGAAAVIDHLRPRLVIDPMLPAPKSAYADLLEIAQYRDERISDLPYGARKNVELARALCAEPSLLLLDEPASGLNNEETDDISFYLEDVKHDLGVTLVMVEHDMNLVGQVADRVMAINDGRLLAIGTPDEVRDNAEVQRAYLGDAA